MSVGLSCGHLSSGVCGKCATPTPDQLRQQRDEAIKRLGDTLAQLWAAEKGRDEARAEVERLRGALELAEVEVALERTWCRICRTEWRSNERNRKGHPHAAGCVLARATPLVTEEKP